MLKSDLLNENFKFENLLVPTEKFKINASIVMHGRRLFCGYRTDHIHNYDPKNYLTELDAGFKIISHKKLTLHNGNTAFEDVRLFNFNNNLFAIYTCFEKEDYKKWSGVYKIEIGVVDVKTGTISNQKSLKKFSVRQHDKNWVPIVSGDFLYLITDFEPTFRVLRAKKKHGFSDFIEFHQSKSPPITWEYGEIRGGTPFLQCNLNNEDWHYSFVHSSLYVPNGNDTSRFYFYTIARYCPKDNRIEFHNTPLNYSKSQLTDFEYLQTLKTAKDPTIRVVFPMGLINWQDGLIVSFGKDDCVSRLQFYSWEYILDLF